MIEMHVGAITLDQATGAPVVFLSDNDTTMALPIWIGITEAKAITMAAQKIMPPRPMTHDLLKNTIDAMGYRLREVRIDSMEGSTFKASLVLVNTGAEDVMEVILDSRPSDALALAILSNAPVFVAPEIVEEASIKITTIEKTQVEEADAAKFKDFISNVKASDFKLKE